MAVVREFKLPDLGEGLTEAEIVRWLVQVGDVVAVDQTVVEVETAKAMVEVPCPYGGVVTARFGEEGTELPVGSPLLTVAVGAAAGTAQEAAPQTSGEEGSGNVLVGYGTAAPAARRRRVRREPAVNGASVHSAQAAPAQSAPPASPVPSVTAGPPARATRPADSGPVPVISPLVRRLARESGLDLRELTG
ncbi:biotin/lipoyl-containing protein, partial [Streptomyces meridianus]